MHVERIWAHSALDRTLSTKIGSCPGVGVVPVLQENQPPQQCNWRRPWWCNLLLAPGASLQSLRWEALESHFPLWKAVLTASVAQAPLAGEDLALFLLASPSGSFQLADSARVQDLVQLWQSLLSEWQASAWSPLFLWVVLFAAGFPS